MMFRKKKECFCSWPALYYNLPKQILMTDKLVFVSADTEYITRQTHSISLETVSIK